MEESQAASPEGLGEAGSSPNPRGMEKGSAWQANPGGLAEILRKKNRMAEYSFEKIQQRRSERNESIKVPMKVEEEKICITVPKEILERNAKRWEFGLVGRFTGPRPDLDKIRRWVDQRWKVKDVEIAALPKGCVLFNFQNQEDMLGVLLKAPWFLEGKGLLLEKWHEDFNPREEEAQMVPVWVQIPDLPLQSWDNDIIGSLANAIGRLLAIDGATNNKTRFIHARFCVLVRTDKKLPKSVELDLGGRKWSQELVYEPVKTRCGKCKRGNHLPQFCKNKEEEPQSENPRRRWVAKQSKGEEETKATEDERKEEETRRENERERNIEKEQEQSTKGGRENEEEKKAKAGEASKEGEEGSRKEEEIEVPDSPKEGSMEEETSDGFEKVQTRRSKRRTEGKMDVGAEERRVGRPTDKERREKEAANQIDLGIQKTLDSGKGKAKIKK